MFLLKNWKIDKKFVNQKLNIKKTKKTIYNIIIRF